MLLSDGNSSVEKLSVVGVRAAHKSKLILKLD